ncbi:MAG: response regulator, partial [Bacteroidia bacterium]
MKTLRVAIVDDSTMDIQLFKNELVFFEKVKVIAQFDHPEKFLSEEKLLNYDAVFLDVEMPAFKYSGMDVARKISKPVI